jgi:hypothetical protein
MAVNGPPPQSLPYIPGEENDPPPTGNELPTEMTVQAGWLVEQWIADANSQNPGLNLSMETMAMLNPIQWTFGLLGAKSVETGQ